MDLFKPSSVLEKPRVQVTILALAYSAPQGKDLPRFSRARWHNSAGSWLMKTGVLLRTKVFLRAQTGRLARQVGDLHHCRECDGNLFADRRPSGENILSLATELNP